MAEAQVEHDKADLEQKKMDLDRSKKLFDDKLIAAQDYEAKRVTYDLAVATLLQSQRRITQAESAKAQALAQLTSTQKKVAQAQAMVSRYGDVLAQYDATAPARRRGDRSSRARRRNGGSRRAEFCRLPPS